MILSYRSRPKLNETEPGYFLIALEALDFGDPLINNFLQAKQTAGTLSIRLLAKGLLADLKPENAYFVKRIIIMEMNDPDRQ